MKKLASILALRNVQVHKFFLLLVAGLLNQLTSYGQPLFIIGDRSYPCTTVMTFESNAEHAYDLDVVIAKEGEFGYVGVSRKYPGKGEKLAGKLIIVLENGTVITCNEIELSEKVDDRAIALYPLTMDQLSKLKKINIHTINYTMIHDEEENFSASNTSVKTNEFINALFDPTYKPNDLPPAPPVVENPPAEESYAYVEQMPTFQGGTEAMYKYIYDTIEYPAAAKEKKVSGQVIIQYVVSAHGEIQHARVIRGIGSGCDEEALRVVKNMPKWNPGVHNGRPVPVTFTLPIKFVL